MSVIKSHGKLLLTAEYLILDGALALAVPTKDGQTLKIEKTNTEGIRWESYDEKNLKWFNATFKVENSKINTLETTNDDISERLVSILNAAASLNPNWLSVEKGYNIQTYLDFNRLWGLGTSSTLINNIAIWANVNPYKLLEMTFGGSGYDIACAQAKGPITYQLENNKPTVINQNFNPSFSDQLYFIYLNKKQNSREGIANYRKNKPFDISIFSEVNAITNSIISCNTLTEFEYLIAMHESLISKIIKIAPIQKTFNDFDGKLKSLGAWGGDFILATSTVDPRPYFKSKGLDTVITYTEMVLN